MVVVGAFALFVGACAGTGVSSSNVVTAPPPTSTSTTSTSTTSTSTTSTSTTSISTTTAPTTTTTTTTTTTPWQTFISCFTEPPPAYRPVGYEFDPTFYRHWCSASGIPVIGSGDVPLVALEAAAQVVNRVIGYDAVNTAETIANGGLVILYGPNETAADLPEWEFVAGQTQRVGEDRPGLTASGGGITFAIVAWDDPVCAVPPERQDAYGTPEWGSVLVHELGHLAAGPATRDRLVDFVPSHVATAYRAALESGSWDHRLYAMSSPAEYWAEATQVYFGQYAMSTTGLRRPRTRVELAEQDPLVTTLLRTVYGDTTRLGSYWCSVYDGPSIVLPGDEPADGYAPVL